MIHKCKFCSHHAASYRVLRTHVELDHPVEFARVTQWLGVAVEPKIQQFEKIANEGLLGHNERRRD